MENKYKAFAIMQKNQWLKIYIEEREGDNVITLSHTDHGRLTHKRTIYEAPPDNLAPMFEIKLEELEILKAIYELYLEMRPREQGQLIVSKNEQTADDSDVRKHLEDLRTIVFKLLGK